MKRRQFLQSSVASGALAFPGASLLAARSVAASPPEGLQRLFGDDMQIRQLGDKYLFVNPGEKDIDVLWNLAVPVDDSSHAAAAIKQDFEGGNVVTIDGWVLSRTEARHCALFSMLSSGFS